MDGFYCFGVLSVLFVTFKLLFSIWDGVKAFIVPKYFGVITNIKKSGKWAVVTGATDGIGRAYAGELARLGLDVCLVSRSADKLAVTAAELAANGVNTKTVVIDFSDGGDIYKPLRSELADLDIGVLVNNVGIGYPHPDFYEALDEDTVRQLITINCSSVAQMCSIVLPGMVARRRGIIINISSASAVRPTPLLTLYSATKAFVDTFSQALNLEYSGKGITVQCVMPFFVATKLSKIRRASLQVPGPQDYVRSALATVGIQARTFGCVPHALQGWFMSRVPDFLVNAVSMKTLLQLRNKAIHKLAKDH